MRTSLAVTLLIAMEIVPSAAARHVENWAYDRLFKEADVIVIASAQKTVDSDDAAPVRWKRSLVGQRTTFSVIETLKGTLPGDRITVVHFKVKDGVVTEDGPMLVAFRTKGISIEGGGPEKYSVVLPAPTYLMFLKRSDGGRLEPVSGQIDPDRSVKEIYPPLPACMDQPLERNRDNGKK